ncbi:MAG: IPT/TIG domain-containing protein [Gaiellaceae bacterium]
MRRAIMLALAFGVALGAGPTSAAPTSTPLRITSVSPTVADRGELVTITGGGFGAGNLDVTVGGDPVELVSATGSRASFRVPGLGRVGEVEVVARNPGGHVGRIGLTVRFDGETEAVVDEAAAVSLAVGSDGGTIGVAGMSLSIPAGAVPEGATITATPLIALTGSPFAAAPVGLKLEPSGLVLLRPATLTLPKPTGDGVVIGFGFDGDGEEFHLVPHELVGDTVELKVWHFSGAGTLTARLDELDAVLGYETTRAHGRAEQRIEAALLDAALNGTNPADAIFAALATWRGSVSNGLQVARDTARLDFFELAFGEWQAWQAYVQEYRDSVTPEQARTFDIFIRFDTTLATAAAYDVGTSVLTRCVGPGVPRSALRDALRLATAVIMASLPIESANDPDERQLPSGDGLARACLDIELLAFEHAPTLARNRDNRFTARAQVSFWNGPASSTIPIRYRLRDATGGPSLPLASGTSATGSYEDTISPGAVGSRHYELTVDLDTSGGDDVLRSFFDRETHVVPVRERLDLQARRPGDAAFGDLIGAIAPGGTALLRIRLAGDDVAGKTIALTHDGSGTVPATATTDANGEALLTYTAAAIPQIELVTATITDSGFTSGDAVVITTRPPIVVAVTPSFGFAAAGESVQFTAAVTGTADHRVSWNVSGAGNTISSTGLFTAGTADGTFTVTATSLADTSSVGTAFVLVSNDNVEGLYIGELCVKGFFQNEFSCIPGMQLAYQCSLESKVGPGRTCGWFASGGGLLQVPNMATFCQIETNGTSSGGAFSGVITWCRFAPPTARQASAVINGSIGDGLISFTLVTTDPDGSTLEERFTGTKFVP